MVDINITMLMCILLLTQPIYVDPMSLKGSDNHVNNQNHTMHYVGTANKLNKRYAKNVREGRYYAGKTYMMNKTPMSHALSKKRRTEEVK